MAESSVASFLEKLGNLASQEASLFGEVEGQVRLLRNELEWMRLFLEYADARRRYDKRLKLWVNQIRDAAHDAEDVLDEFMFKVEHKRQQRLHRLKFLRFLPSCVSVADKLPFIQELNDRITEINITIEKILANKKRYGIENPSTSEAWSSSNEVPCKEKTLPVVEEIDVVGFETDVKSVKELLVEAGETTETRRVVVSIVGMGGLGKTTLAKKVYNDVKQHFDCDAWVYVSQEYRTRDLLFEILNCVTNEKRIMRELDSEAAVGIELRNFLSTKKYLIVMDDIWCTQVWKGLNVYLPIEGYGSRVLITARNKEVALHANSHLHELHPLNEMESEELFLRKMGSSTLAWPQGLEKLGKEIVAKCKGLPLATVMLGGLLSMKEKTQFSWQKVLDSKDWHLSQGPNSCLGILALSYNDLPNYLKSCFLYCGIFPENSKVKSSELIRLWIAEGFVQTRGAETLEDLAEDYLYELIQRNMIQVDKRDRLDGRVKSCRMHDFLRDLAISEAKDAKLFEVHENIDVRYPISSRRLSIQQSLIKKNISQHLHNSRLRSLIFLSEPLQENSWTYLQEHIKLLQVLDLGVYQYQNIYTLPRKVGELINLKYLCLRGAGNRIRLPTPIVRLVNLQTLDLDGNLLCLPCKIWKLQQLRHLNCPGGIVSRKPFTERFFINGDLGVHQLTNLQTLALQGGEWLEGDGLGQLTQLRQLKIMGGLTPYLKEGFFKSIAQLTALENLKLINFSSKRKTIVSGFMSFSHHTRLQKLVLGGRLEKLPVDTGFYPPNLLQLKLWETELEQDPMSILGELPNLRILKLLWNSYVGKKMNCSEGRFHQLEFLHMEHLSNLEDFTVEEGAMPKLRTLQMEWFWKMKKFPDGLLGLRNLQELNLLHCSNELLKEVFQTQGEDWNRIRLITSQTHPISDNTSFILLDDTGFH